MKKGHVDPHFAYTCPITFENGLGILTRYVVVGYMCIMSDLDQWFKSYGFWKFRTSQVQTIIWCMMLVISHAIEPLYFRQNWFFWHFFFCAVFLSSWRFRICLTFVLGCPGSKVMDVYFFVFICMTNLAVILKNLTVTFPANTKIR